MQCVYQTCYTESDKYCDITAYTDMQMYKTWSYHVANSQRNTTQVLYVNSL